MKPSVHGNDFAYAATERAYMSAMTLSRYSSAKALAFDAIGAEYLEKVGTTSKGSTIYQDGRAIQVSTVLGTTVPRNLSLIKESLGSQFSEVGLADLVRQFSPSSGLSSKISTVSLRALALPQSSLAKYNQPTPTVGLPLAV